MSHTDIKKWNNNMGKYGNIIHEMLFKPIPDEEFALQNKWTAKMLSQNTIIMNETRELTYGEKSVGLTFNPGGMPEVNSIKRLSADLIDELQTQLLAAKAQNNGEKIAQFTLAIRKIQEGQMWGVKACTWQY